MQALCLTVLRLCAGEAEARGREAEGLQEELAEARAELEARAQEIAQSEQPPPDPTCALLTSWPVCMFACRPCQHRGDWLCNRPFVLC